MSIAVLLVDDHGAIRSGLRLILETHPDLRVVGEAGDGASALAMTRALEPDVVLMDIRMPGRDGIWATARIVAETRSRVLILSTFGLDEPVSAALLAGATGFLQKSVSGPELIAAVLKTARGEAVLSPEVTATVIRGFRALAERPPAPEPPSGLTPREREVLLALGGGLSNAAIARELGISEATVKTHLTAIYAKTGSASRVEAALLGLGLGGVGGR
ncbi:response regulator [Mycetocola spongiae]|uniref:response regulator n=1 Tax=Mycetocola spongiae TaxID=2859226 RepID=UPI001CF13C1A|nr:response regulator transcription factor [Mycetocola spongiae]UCR90099.1 response regulator transcription factor [Mycetocola spongiae]